MIIPIDIYIQFNILERFFSYYPIAILNFKIIKLDFYKLMQFISPCISI